MSIKVGHNSGVCEILEGHVRIIDSPQKVEKYLVIKEKVTLGSTGETDVCRWKL